MATWRRCNILSLKYLSIVSNFRLLFYFWGSWTSQMKHLQNWLVHWTVDSHQSLISDVCRRFHSPPLHHLLRSTSERNRYYWLVCSLAWFVFTNQVWFKWTKKQIKKNIARGVSRAENVLVKHFLSFKLFQVHIEITNTTWAWKPLSLTRCWGNELMIM